MASCKQKLCFGMFGVLMWVSDAKKQTVHNILIFFLGWQGTAVLLTAYKWKLSFFFVCTVRQRWLPLMHESADNVMLYFILWMWQSWQTETEQAWDHQLQQQQKSTKKQITTIAPWAAVRQIGHGHKQIVRDLLCKAKPKFHGNWVNFNTLFSRKCSFWLIK